MFCSFAFGFSIKIWMASPRITSVQYIGGCSVHWGCSADRIVNMSTSGASWFMWESKLIKAFDLYWNLKYWTSPDIIMISSHMNHNVPHLHHGNPLVFWTYLNVLLISPNVLMVYRQCTKHSPPPPPPYIYRTLIMHDALLLPEWFVGAARRRMFSTLGLFSRSEG